MDSFIYLRHGQLKLVEGDHVLTLVPDGVEFIDCQEGRFITFKNDEDVWVYDSLEKDFELFDYHDFEWLSISNYKQIVLYSNNQLYLIQDHQSRHFFDPDIIPHDGGSDVSIQTVRWRDDTAIIWYRIYTTFSDYTIEEGLYELTPNGQHNLLIKYQEEIQDIYIRRDNIYIVFNKRIELLRRDGTTQVVLEVDRKLTQVAISHDERSIAYINYRDLVIVNDHRTSFKDFFVSYGFTFGWSFDDRYLMLSDHGRLKLFDVSLRKEYYVADNVNDACWVITR